MFPDEPRAMTDNTVDWKSITLSVLGGDEREQEIARLAAENGIPWPDGGIAGVQRCHDTAEALAGASYVLFSVAGFAADGSLFAPHAAAPIYPDSALLADLAPGAHLIVGLTNEMLRNAVSRLDVSVHEYGDDVELTLQRAPAVVEGALAITIANTAEALHHSDVAILGFGTIGKQLTQALMGLGARVHVVARNAIQRASARALGADDYDFTQLDDLLPRMLVVFTTVPQQVLDRGRLERMDSRTLIVDLAAPPGGVMVAAAEELGVQHIWARGLGNRAPITVGRSQWSGIRRRIEEIQRALPERSDTG